jgi:hypothetical protein
MRPPSGSDTKKASAHRRPAAHPTSAVSSAQKSGNATTLARSRIVA